MLRQLFSPRTKLDKPALDRQTQEALRWERMGELWAEDQFGSVYGREASLRLLAERLSTSRTAPNQHQWSRLILAYERRWDALRRDWALRRSYEPKPYLYRALGFLRNHS